MKLFFFLTLLFGLAVALELSEVEKRQDSPRTQRRASRPQKTSEISPLTAANKPNGAPAEYEVGTAYVAHKRSTSELREVTPGLVDAGLRRRRESLRTLRLLQRQLAKQEFYECQNSSPAPKDADCQAIVSQVQSTKQTLVVQTNACLTFSYQTCLGYFCSLCDTLATTTDFIGSQLDSVEFLCVSDGKAGTIVGQDSPQWDVGFVRAGNDIPTYDVC